MSNKLTSFEIFMIESLASSILNALKSSPADNQIIYKAMLQVLDSLIVSTAKDNDCMILLIEDAKNHLSELTQKSLEEWKIQFGEQSVENEEWPDRLDASL